MKTLMIVLTSLLLQLSCFAQVEISEDQKSAAIYNLTEGIKSDNGGLAASSAVILYNLIDEGYMQRDYSSRPMIPLLRLLDNGETDEVRIAAALALYKLGNGIGIYNLRSVAIFDDNEKVSSICKNLYYSYHKINGSEYFLNF